MIEVIIDIIFWGLICLLFAFICYYIVILICCIGELAYLVFAKPIINKFKKKTENRKRKDNMSNTYVTLDEFLNEDNEAIKQVVYKVDGDFNGNIKGENVTVILMGDGNINGNVKCENGEVVLIRGGINGDVKADKVICPQPKTEYEEYIDKLSGINKLSESDEEEGRCSKCYWYSLEKNVCEYPYGCEFMDKDSFKQPPPDYVDCADCIYAQKCNGGFMCFKFNGSITRGGSRVCNSFKQKEHRTCKSCYHCYVGDCKGFYKGFYCTKDKGLNKMDNLSICQYYDNTGATTKHKNDCIRYSNDFGRCSIFCIDWCPSGCPYKAKRGEDIGL